MPKNKRKSKRKKNGFTLIEIVIALILVSMLSIVAITGYNSLKNNASDAKRIKDLQTLKAAVELYKQDKGHYPISSGFQDIKDVSGNIGEQLVSSGYISKIPTDPTGVPYQYNSLPGGNGFKVTTNPILAQNGKLTVTELNKQQGFIDPASYTGYDAASSATDPCKDPAAAKSGTLTDPKGFAVYSTNGCDLKNTYPTAVATGTTSTPIQTSISTSRPIFTGPSATPPTPSPTPNLCSSLTNGLAAYWKLDESQWNGTVGEVADSTGNITSCSAVNTVVSVNGKFNHAAAFTPNGNEIHCTSLPSSFINPTAYTFSAWVYLKSTKSNNQPIMVVAKPNSHISSRILMIDAGNQHLRANTSPPSNNDADSTSVENIPLNTWTHVVTTYNAKGDKIQHLYINGTEVHYSAQSTTAEPIDESGDYYLMGNSDDLIRPLNGKIDDARVYNRAMSPSEISSLFSCPVL